MPTVLFAILVVRLWSMVGLGAALVFLGRHGYRDGAWYFLGAVLGPLFVPIAIERGRRGSRVLERTSVAGTLPAGQVEGAVPAGQVVVLVGVDGSAESDRAVRDVAALFGPARARIVLAAVADPSIGEFGGDAQQKWHDLLADRAGWLPPDGPAPVLEVLCGQPDLVLLEAAEAEKADALVIGRRGRGLSHRLLGSVAESLTRRATIPVLLAGPASRRAGTAHGPARWGVAEAN
ncbi:universal stress protein [Blastococcus sp. KM273129]|uniref:universal stress protein n=1 Tax=Blastococcus sp. KM273129 TaxID=2570315 RepID=UPI001F258F6E|nr:universal stress protein [Blastococcus sp. KM273129]MCF6735538.1 universal stress protein [Blastococcus sp. KM273129]